MAVEFPNNPLTGQYFTSGSRRWRFNGREWSPVASLTLANRQNVDLPDLDVSNAGAAGDILTRTATAMQWRKQTTPGASHVKAAYVGLRTRSTGSATFEIGRGYCGTFDGGDVLHVDSPISAAVSDALLDAGTLAANETYYVWLFINSGTGGILPRISLSRTTPQSPHAHVRGRMIGTIETNADASGITAFTAYNDGPSKEIVTDSGTTTLNLAA